MRASLALFFALVAAPAAALDCEALTARDVPFAVSYRMTRSAPDGSTTDVATGEQVQVLRRRPETLAYNVTAPGQWSRAGAPGSGYLPREIFSSASRATRTWRYSIDIAGDYLTTRQPLDFTAELREADGAIVTQARMTVSFAGTTGVQAEGCNFTVLKLVRTMDGTSQGRPLSHRVENWWVPELRVSLFTRIANPSIAATATAARISRDFTPPE